MIDEHLMDNPRSERVKRIASLATRAGRKKHRLFLAEGPQAVREALTLWLARYEPQEHPSLSVPGASAHLPELDAFFFDASAVQRFPDVEALLDRLRAVLFDPTVDLPRGGRLFLREATPDVLAAMGDAETSQGLLAVARIPERSSDFAALQSVTAAGSPSLIAGMVRVQDPGNVGTMIRTADAAGADMVVLSSGSADPWAPKVVRSAAGSHFHVPVFTGADMGDYARLAQSAGVQVLASAAEAEAKLTQLAPSGEEAGPLAERTLWLFGNEARGLTQQDLESADQAVAIPIYGRAESLNVSTAATICLYATAMAQRPLSSNSSPPSVPNAGREAPA